MSDGFLGRWSRRKLDVKEGKPVQAEPPPQSPAAQPPAAPPVSASNEEAGRSLAPPKAGPEREVQVPLPPTLEDVEALTPESDFKRFAGADVAPEVRNAAMKKLFADPRYNVMDGLDVYIDDYSRPDPIPRPMLRQLAAGRFLGLFREDERKEEQAVRPRDDADNPKPQMVAQSGSVPQSVPGQPIDADPDLQLQQDHAAPGKDPGRGTG